MRPKKTILLYCADTMERSLLSMNLNVWGYKVTRCGSEYHPCLQCLRKRRYDLLLVALTGRQCGQPVPAEFVPLFNEQAYRGDRVLLLDPDADAPAAVMAMEPWRRIEATMGELRAEVELATQRKRGPKKRYFGTAVGMLGEAVAA